jgi:hypothetical protein
MNLLYILATILGLALLHLVDTSKNKEKDNSDYDIDMIHEQNLMQENNGDDTDQFFNDNIFNEDF